MNRRTLLLGRSGQLGTALGRLLDDVIAPGHEEFDLTSVTHDQTRELVDSVRPGVVINCAAYTAVDAAEEEREVADAINGFSVGVLAEVTADRGIPLVTYSTDYVFDGKAAEPYVESSPTEPVNAYGASKLLGEHLVLNANPIALVIRTSWVISGTHRNFVATMLRLAGEGKQLKVVDDQHGCPTIVGDLARSTLEAVRVSATGLLHLTNQGATTWFHLAQASLSLAGLDPDLVQPCGTDDYPTPAKRPAFSVLGSEKRSNLGVGPLPDWHESLPMVVHDLIQLARTDEK